MSSASPQSEQRHVPKALITGITGQDGSYLAELLLRKGYEVYGVVRRSSSSNTDRIDHLELNTEETSGQLHLIHGDLCDTSSLDQALDRVRPNEIYNLGAQSHVQVSFENPEYTADATGLGTIRLLEAIRRIGLESRFYQASSSELFGKALEIPQSEATPFYPRNPYAAAKAYAFYVTRLYREAYGMFAVNGILFNHESPRRGEAFVTRKITKGVALLARGDSSPIRLGNLDARRDWGFAGDYVEAMWKMLQIDAPDDFVICTGETYSVREFCEAAFRVAKLDLTWEGSGVNEKGVAPNGRLLVEVDREYFRPAEVDTLQGDYSKALQQLDWKPKTNFLQLVEMMVLADLKSS